jgi:hypothetical protein
MAIIRVRTPDNLSWIEVGLPPQAPSANTVVSDATVQPTASKITVSPNSLPPAAPVVNDLWVVNDVPSITTSSIGEIDHAERNTAFDIQAIGTTYTDIDGLQITVPPQTQSYMMTFSGLVNATTTATATNGTLLGAFFRIYDPNSTATWAYTAATFIQVGTAALSFQAPVFMGRRMNAHTTSRTYKVQVRTSVGVPAGWGTLILQANDAPNTGIYPPAYLRAETV